MTLYGDQGQNMIHYIASHGNVEQIDGLVSTPHWEKLKAVRYKKAKLHVI
jgi:hypothetical protein